jgi:hypothetical protein
MQFINFISDTGNIFNKSCCPQECDVELRNNIPIVGISEPQKQNKLLGVIISRDPTTAFIDPYLKAKQTTPEGWHDQLMTAKAPPQWVLKQITTFNKKYLENKYMPEIERLREIMEKSVYWTHLHKCCTDKLSQEAPMFKTKNARLCADQWLKQELNEAIGQGATFITCVGNDAKAWVSKWEIDNGAKGVKVFYLPHPSGAANGAWNPKDENKMKALKGNIVTLLESLR